LSAAYLDQLNKVEKRITLKTIRSKFYYFALTVDKQAQGDISYKSYHSRHFSKVKERSNTL